MRDINNSELKLYGAVDWRGATFGGMVCLKFEDQFSGRTFIAQLSADKARDLGRDACELADKIDGIDPKAQAGSSYLYTKDVSRMTGIPVETIRGWRCRGKGPPFFKLEGVVLYASEDVDDWIAANRVDPRSAATKE